MYKNYTTLTSIYNTLSLIPTKGENTILMGQCLFTLRDVLMDMEKQFNTDNINNKIPEELKDDGQIVSPSC